MTLTDPAEGLDPIAGARVRARRKWPVSGESGRRFMIQ